MPPFDDTGKNSTLANPSCVTHGEVNKESRHQSMNAKDCFISKQELILQQAASAAGNIQETEKTQHQQDKNSADDEAGINTKQCHHACFNAIKKWAFLFVLLSMLLGSVLLSLFPFHPPLNGRRMLRRRHPRKRRRRFHHHGLFVTPRLEAFRSLLLSHSVSSRQNLYDQRSPQYQALAWLANYDQAQLNVSPTMTHFEAILSRYVMAAVYFANGGVNWINQCNFLSPSSICDWNNAVNVGVFCNPLQLKFDGNNNLNGTILTELGQLLDLEYLSFRLNHLSGTIPLELTSLPALNHFILDSNNVHGTILTEFGQLTRLVYLGLSSNQLMGTIPTEIARLVNLNYLEFGRNNQLQGTILTELGVLSKLLYLDLSFDSLSGTVPTSFAAFPNLQYLLLYGNTITGNLTPFFCNRSA